ncbi:hypothetical protein GCM10010924_52690 [Rhizobium wenxiniae]|uniref:Preprotein translocase subunit YajC n=1 Tax=Rhizobium wenxiniae TaxID=1737357 RepID=A0A7W9YDB9_9HYPH|nr:hypothetical protein [Rhizobium wenxiniae]MBB6165633.1 preprotein translocase subunit YajC [Rhizobium wenxiniae]GGG17126.1 hypothetical protein GCM10010924_52690 [Rhizobium wenxiniae]
MTTMTFAPMIALAVFLIVVIGVFTFIILRRGKLKDRNPSQVDPDKPTAEWLKREAAKGKRPF